MLVCRDESIAFSPEDRGTVGLQVQAWVSEMEQRGVRLQGEVLAVSCQSEMSAGEGWDRTRRRYGLRATAA